MPRLKFPHPQIVMPVRVHTSELDGDLSAQVHRVRVALLCNYPYDVVLAFEDKLADVREVDIPDFLAQWVDTY